MKEITLFKEDGHTSMGEYGIELKIKVPNSFSKKRFEGTYELLEKLKDEVLTEMVLSSPNIEKKIKEKTRSILNLFPELVFAERIENEYWSDWRGIDEPWFLVTTKFGRIKIGKRKRVYLIDWNQTFCSLSAEELFPKEDVTKFDCSIHAWSLEKAKEYIEKIMCCCEKTKDNSIYEE